MQEAEERPCRAEIHSRESAFHDRWAEGTALDAVQITEAFESITAPENRFIRSVLGDVRGMKLLDVGAGLGEAALYFARQGAEVTAVDISPQMVALCLENAKRLGLAIQGIAASAENLVLPQESFDIVYAANVLHHVAEKDRFLKTIHSALKPGGVFVAWDPLKYNPVINVYRRIASEVRSPDERPLGMGDLRLARKYFPDLQHREFWFCTLALFLKYALIDRKDPNKVRYWKAILSETPETIGWWFTPLQKLDEFLLRAPFAGCLAWNVVQWGRKR